MTEKTLSSRVIYEGRAVRVRLDTVEKPGGEKTTREIVEHADCIAVIAVDEGDNVLLVSQFRKPVEEELLEIPAGGIDPGEEPVEAVQREMREETGFLPRRVERLGGFYSAPGYSSEYLYLYLATDLVADPLVAEDTGGIDVVPVPVSRIRGDIDSGRIRDAKSIAGLLVFVERREKRGGP